MVYTNRISAIQSDHWKSSSVTIFVCVLTYLSIVAWNTPPIDLKKGTTVSVITETNDRGGVVYVYGEVHENQVKNSSTIEVRHPSTKTICSYPCELVKVRLVPIIVVSDSKLHDTYFVCFFLMYKLLGQDGWLYTQTREVGLRGRIKRIFIDSDGASAHFKQRGSIHFITFLCIFFGLLISWTFGCPCHGKGMWAGLGGIVKIKTGDYIRAMDSFLSSAKEVFEVIFDLFASDKA
jgi:hypothetical protein